QHKVTSAMARNIWGRLRCVLNERQVFGHVRLRHQRPVFAASQAMLDPGRILVTRDADTQIKGAAAQPTEKNVSMRQLAAVLTFFLSEDQIKHRSRARR